MLQLTVLGTTDFAGPNGGRCREFLAKPKRLAVLVYLALARPRGFHRRDTLAALFWPELDQHSARRALRQTLYVIRHDLLPGLVISRGDEEIALDLGLLQCDVIEFEAALDDGDPAGALDRYGGELLTGFHLPDTPDFERWIEDERARLKLRAIQAATRAARESRDPATAAVWTRRGLAFAPDDETLARLLITALDRDGDQAGALRAYDDFARRLQLDLEVEPAPETSALAAAIRARPGLPSPPLDHKPVVPNPPEPIRDRRVPGPRALPAGLALALLVVIGAGLGIVAAVRRTRAKPIRLVVLPFENLGGSSTEPFADGLTGEITTRLSYVSGLSVIAASTAGTYRGSTRPAAAIGKELDVDYVLEGTVQWDSSGGAGVARVSAQLVRVANGTSVWAGSEQVSLTNVFDLQASVAARVAAALEVNLTGLERHLVRDPPTPNAEAHGYYLRARERYRQAAGRYEESVADLRTVERWLERATALDSTFALAWADLARVRLVRWRTTSSDTATLAAGLRAADRALSIQPGLAAALVARALVEGDGFGRWARAASLLEDAVRRQPSDADAWTELAWVEVRRKRWRSALDAIDRAVALDPGSAGKLTNQGLIASWNRLGDRAVASYRRAIALEPAQPSVYLSLASVLVNHLGDSVTSAEVLDEGDRRFGRLGLVRGSCLSCLFENWWVARYVDLLDSLPLEGPAPPDSADFYFAKGQAARLRGEPTAAMAYFDSVLSVEMGRARAPRPPGWRRNVGLILLNLGRREEGFRELAAAQRQGGFTFYSPAGLWAYAHLYAGEFAAAADSFAVAVGDPEERVITRYLLRFDPRLKPLRRLPTFRALFQ